MPFQHKGAASPLRQYLNTAEAAIYLNVSRQFLEQDRVTARYRVPYYKFGASVRYDLRELDQWAGTRRHA